MSRSIAWMENLTHVVVSVGKKPDEETPKQFHQGGIQGDVLLFELESGKFLDGAAVMATNTQAIKVRQKYTEIDLRLNLQNQFELAIKSLFSDLGSKAPR